MTGKRIQGKKARGMQRQMMLPYMAEDYVITTNDMLHAAKDRRKWKAMTTYAQDGHGTKRDRERESFDRANKHFIVIEGNYMTDITTQNLVFNISTAMRCF